MWRLYLIGAALGLLALAASHLWAYEHGRSYQAGLDNVAELQRQVRERDRVINAQKDVLALKQREAADAAAALADAAARDAASRAQAETDKDMADEIKRQNARLQGAGACVDGVLSAAAAGRLRALLKGRPAGSDHRDGGADAAAGAVRPASAHP